jgi:hypothetical protein
MPTPPQEFLHVTSDSFTASVIEETLRRLGREEVAIGMRESLAAGPLQDVDSGGALRAAWWTRILGETTPDVPSFDESDLWARVKQGSEAVVLWHGPHPFERMEAHLSGKIDGVDAGLSASLQRLENKVDAGFARVDRELGLVKAAVLEHDRELRAMGRSAH